MGTEDLLKQREYSRKSYWKNHDRTLELARNRAAKSRELNREEYNRKMREYNAANKERINSKRRERRANDKEYAETVRARDRARSPEQRRAARLKRDYGITLDEYNLLLDKQEHKCAICGTDESDSLGRNFHVDHCHTSGVVRGLLCSECNTGLGKFKDRPDVLLKAIQYLRRK